MSDQKPVLIPSAPYISPDYARAEADKLWPKVWQVACRAEEVPKVGDYVTYDIQEQSIIVVRTAADKIEAFYNVCMHRGRRLTSGCGHTAQFYCRFHGWKWHLNGENAFVLDQDDWGEALNKDNLRLGRVLCDTWGGWVFINMDLNAEPLATFLDPVAGHLDPYNLDKMHYRWRQWLVFPCNWKAAIAAFDEGYHVLATHPQLLRGGPGSRSWSKIGGRHAWQGDAGPRGAKDGGAGIGTARGDVTRDPRVAVRDDVHMIWNTLNATTTETFVNIASTLPEDLPEGSSFADVGMHVMKNARANDAARGVPWPDVDMAYIIANSAIWHIFPNTVIINSMTTALCYRARPNGFDPDSCIFEVYVIERFPEGEAPQTEWVHAQDPTEENWRLILSQDFQNMPEVQRGMKSRGFPGARPSPLQELAVIHFHQMLADYMGEGAPEVI